MDWVNLGKSKLDRLIFAELTIARFLQLNGIEKYAINLWYALSERSA